MNVGLYFGSFNPIHVGHLIIASYVAQNTPLDQVWFVVSPQNPLKKPNSLLNEYHRLYLVKLAIEDDVLLKCSDVEFHLPRPSYTIDTLTYLSEKYPQHKFALVIGSDSYQNLQHWKNSDVIMKKYFIYVYNRPGFEILSHKAFTTVNFIKAPLLDISSTMVRRFRKEGLSIRYLVPDKVFNEIESSNYFK